MLRANKPTASRTLLAVTLTFCAGMLCLLTAVAFGQTARNLDSFAERVLTLDRGWTITDSAGDRQTTDLPLTVPYGADGRYTLSAVLPSGEGLIDAPVLRFYSNYVDVTVELEGETLYTYPAPGTGYASTGNTYHFIRLPIDYGGKTVTITLRGQLGSGITYLLRPPLLGSKASMLRTDVLQSLPGLLLAGCMLVLAVGLTTLYLIFRRLLRLSGATLYTALFAALFAAYVFCETTFAQVLLPNGYALCSCTLMLLALLPIPLMGLFTDEVSSRFASVPAWLMLLCSANFVAQTVLNFTGIVSFRVALPATHGVIILSIAVMAYCLLRSDRREQPNARSRLLAAAPMILGGLTDITLLALEKPSFNNSFWFTLGVTVFILLQFRAFVHSVFGLYRQTLETRLLRDMAYRDDLTGIGNRNAYERRLKELSGKSLDGLSCIVLDINDLKKINDTLGHQAGDAAIVEVGRLLGELVPASGASFRTGGDEFVVLLEGRTEEEVQALAAGLVLEAALRGEELAIPLSLATGSGSYQSADGNLMDFLRRVDSCMYNHKRTLKSSEAYPLKT